MRKRRMTEGGCLFTVGVVALVLFFGIFRLVTGHLPEYAAYMVLGYVAISIFGEAYIEIQNVINERADEIKTEIKERMKHLEDRIEEEVRKLKQK